MASFMPTVPLDSLAPAEGTHTHTHIHTHARTPAAFPGIQPVRMWSELKKERKEKTKENRHPVICVHTETAATVSGRQRRRAGGSPLEHQPGGVEKGRRSEPDNRGRMLHSDRCTDRQTDGRTDAGRQGRMDRGVEGSRRTGRLEDSRTGHRETGTLLSPQLLIVFA